MKHITNETLFQVSLPWSSRNVNQVLLIRPSITLAPESKYPWMFRVQTSRFRYAQSNHHCAFQESTCTSLEGCNRFWLNTRIGIYFTNENFIIPTRLSKLWSFHFSIHKYLKLWSNHFIRAFWAWAFLHLCIRSVNKLGVSSLVAYIKFVFVMVSLSERYAKWNNLVDSDDECEITTEQHSDTSG